MEREHLLRLQRNARAPVGAVLGLEGNEEAVPEVSGAREHLDALASKYAGRPIRYFGDAIPARFAEAEIPVLCRIAMTHVVAVDATPGGEVR